MLLSMTGYGDARQASGEIGYQVEIRAVNNRYLKLNTRLPDGFSGLEPVVEKVVRETISRGTITVTIKRTVGQTGTEFSFDPEVLESYLKQWDQLRESMHQLPVLNAGDLLQLPGVVVEPDESGFDMERAWAQIEPVLREALQKFDAFRKHEGESMSDDLRSQIAKISEQVKTVSERAPLVVTQYRDRILERVRSLLEDTDVELQASDVLREVSQFADRCDINEEIIRLESHLQHFEKFIASEESEGKRLDFLSQEINREVNTIGSKANDVEIAHCVVEMKAAVEKMREVLQNVE
ncbi:MAG: YicC family protein [Planctomycetaceae bacterium]|nr:YicC family protein [Planctomycetaceae bacterium]